MKILKFYIVNRLLLIIVFAVSGVLLHLYVDAVSAWLCYIFSFISLFLYFFVGTMRIVQEAVAEGDVDLATKYLNQIKFPRLLFKPFRATYYMVQSNMALVSNNLDTAEASIRKSMTTKSSILGDTKGNSMLQLAFIQLKKGENKEARKSLLEAVKAGISDKESLAAAYLQLCSLEIHRNQNRIAKEYFKKAKAQKPKNEELVQQIKTMDKQIARLPG